jgi:PPOX class probable F420-dependent enzyme
LERPAFQATNGEAREAGACETQSRAGGTPPASEPGRTGFAYHPPMPTRTPTTPLPDHVRRFLEEPRYAAIATVDEDGAPRQAVIWFLLDGDQIVINSLDGRRWPTNLRRDPRISIAITDAKRQSWVGLNGTVEVIEDQAQAQADIAAMANRYNADDPAEADRLIRARFEKQQRVSFRVAITGFHDHIED